jgi:hypothetical protein
MDQYHPFCIDLWWRAFLVGQEAGGFILVFDSHFLRRNKNVSVFDPAHKKSGGF